MSIKLDREQRNSFMTVTRMRFTYQSGDQPLSGYTIQRGIHRGGFGEVYFALSDGGKEVALKLLHQQDQDIELRGVTQCLNLKHPNLVNLFDVKSNQNGEHWVVMEYVSGSSLEDVLASFPDGLPMTEVRDWLSGLVAGVAYLHDRGIVHRDLKPANVYRENGVVKVGDVGLSKRLESDHRRQHTQSVGTVYYMAPEVAKGQYGPEVDVYSLGIMLYELLTGKLPFTGETTAEVLMKHLTAQPDLTPISKVLRPVLARVLEKDPRKRTPTARQLEHEFLRAIGNSERQTDQSATNDSKRLPPIPPSQNGSSKEAASPWISIRVNRPMPNQPVAYKQWMNPFGRSTARGQRQSNWAILTVLMLIMFGPQVFLAARGNHFGTELQFVPEFLSGGFAPLIGIGLIFAAFIIALKQQRKSCSTDGTSRDQFLRAETPVFIPNPPKSRLRDPVPCRGTNVPLQNRSSDPDKPAVADASSDSLASALVRGAVIASCLSAGFCFSLAIFRNGPFLSLPVHAPLFAATSVVGVWLMMIWQAWSNRCGLTTRQQRITRALAGCIVGACAYGLDEWLLVTTPATWSGARSMYLSLGSVPFRGEGIDPSWLGYTWFFACLFAVRRWSQDMVSDRKQRFRWWNLVAAMFVAYAISRIFAFPQWYGMFWAGTISATLQLASSWSPARKLRQGGVQ